MKLKLLYTVQALLVAHLCTAQLLYSENFDNLAIGDLSTDPTGTTAGQGGWYVKAQSNNTSNVRIEAEPGRGNILLLNYPGNLPGMSAEKRDLNIVWSQRIPSNNVIKVEYDFFTGNEVIEPPLFNLVETSGFKINMKNINNNTNSTTFYNYRHYSSVLTAMGGHQLGHNNQILTLVKNSWIKLAMYIDYPNNKVHFVIPSLGIRKEYPFLINAKLPITIDNYTPFSILIGFSGGGINYQRPVTTKYDNLTITAVNQVPLNIEEVLASKFNIFPNPVTDVVTITNNENIAIEEVIVYEMNGKIVKLQKSNNESEIQLNMESFATGTYLLHIETKEGMAVKKVIKN